MGSQNVPMGEYFPSITFIISPQQKMTSLSFLYFGTLQIFFSHLNAIFSPSLVEDRVSFLFAL